MAIPSVEKQSELIAHIDKLIENMKKQLETIEKLRTTLLVQWLVKGDEKKFREIMMYKKATLVRLIKSEQEYVERYGSTEAMP